jgi:hypothetical protein
LSAKANRGVFYTPPAVARLIVAPVLDRLLVGRTPAEVRRLTLLDPACGDGSLLVCAARQLLDWYQAAAGTRRLRLAERCRIVRRHVFGVDVDARAVEQARQALRLLLLKDVSEPSPGGDALDLSANVKCGDALRGTDFDWDAEFPQVMGRGGFSAVVGNPPWVSLAGRFGSKLYPASEIAHLSHRFDGNTYLPNLYEFFIALGLELTAPGGYLSFLVPDRLGFNQHLRRLRERILRETHILSLQYRVPFPGVTADTLIFLLRKGRPAADARVEVIDTAQTPVHGLQRNLASHPARVFRLIRTTGSAALLEKIERAPNVVPLGELCNSASGFGGRSAAIHPARRAASQMPVLKGDSIERYTIRKIYWFDFVRENLTGRTVDRAKLGAAPKIVLRKTGDRIIATYDDSGVFPEQSLYFLYNIRGGFDLRFLLAVLNSRLVSDYYRARLLTNAGSIAQVKKADLDRLPVPRPGKEVHDRLVGLVGEMLKRQRTGTDRRIEAIVRQLYGYKEDHDNTKGRKTKKKGRK